MKTKLTLLSLLVSAMSFASGPQAIYTILSDAKIDTAKNEVVLTGKFKIMNADTGKFGKVQEGYMYFQGNKSALAEKQWEELKKTVKTGKCAGFHDTFAFEKGVPTVRDVKVTPEKPDFYYARGSGNRVIDPKNNPAQFKLYCSDLK